MHEREQELVALLTEQCTNKEDVHNQPDNGQDITGGAGVASQAVGYNVPHRIFRWYRVQGAQGRQGNQQMRLLGFGYQHGRQKRDFGYLDVGKRERQFLDNYLQ